MHCVINAADVLRRKTRETRRVTLREVCAEQTRQPFWTPRLGSNGKTYELSPGFPTLMRVLVVSKSELNSLVQR
jgi:hypothetical protein